MNDFNFLFSYFEKEEISLDKSEFLFQMESHPEYPSLLAVSDTLSFLNIKNMVARIDFDKIENIPDRFVSLLTNSNHSSELYFIEKKENKYIYTENKKSIEISQAELKSRWKGIVIVAEKEDSDNSIDTKKNNFFWILPIVSLLLYLSLLFISDVNLTSKLYVIFPIIGTLFSIAALKDLLGTNNKIINDFCNLSSSTSCSLIVASEKWKFFKYFNFSDLSIVFFISQFFGLLVFILSNDSTSFFAIQKVIALLSIPIIVLSLYYQKYVEGKWCPVCLSIIGIVVLEAIYLFAFWDFGLIISSKSLLVYGFICSGTILFWLALKRLLTLQKNLKEFQLFGNRFIRNYDNFKKVLLSKSKIQLADSPIIIGNPESKTEITIITSPFCGYCKEAHEILEKILIGTENQIKIKMLINADMDSLTEEKKMFFRTLLGIYIEKGQDLFLGALHDWFNNKNLKEWNEKYTSNYNEEQVDSFYKLQYEWSIANNTFLTPAIFINGYRYPRSYRRDDLKFFINDILEDDF